MKSIEIMEALTDLDDDVLGIEAKNNVKKKTGAVRWLGRVAAVAAVIMLMTVSVFAADVVLNDGAMAACISEKLNEGVFVENDRSDNSIKVTKPVYSAPREEVTDTMGSATGNGARITFISAISDGRICYLRIRLEAPEGIVLEDLPESRKYAFSSKTDHDSIEALYKAGPRKLNDVKATVLPDENPTDNVKEFVLEMHCDWMFGFIGDKMRIRIPGLWVRGVNESTERNYDRKLFSAELELEFPVENRNEKIDLKNLEVSHYIEKYDFTVKLERITITPLRLEVHYTSTLPEDENVLPNGGYVQIVMKDGTRLTFGDQSEVSDGPDVGYQLLSKFCEFNGLDFNNFYTRVARELYLDQTIKFGFEEELALDEIDYIVWCGGQIIEIN